MDGFFALPQKSFITILPFGRFSLWSDLSYHKGIKNICSAYLFDDSIEHIDAAKSVMSSTLVPYYSTDLLNKYHSPSKAVIDNIDNAQFIKTNKKVLKTPKNMNK